MPVVTDLVVSASGAYVAGSFDRVGDTPAAGILRWDDIVEGLPASGLAAFKEVCVIEPAHRGALLERELLPKA